MRVLKFGGSSVASPERVQSVVAIVREARKRGPVVIVVSAFGGVTDMLVRAGAEAARGDGAWQATYDELASRHCSAIEWLAAENERPRLHEDLRERLG